MISDGLICKNKNYVTSECLSKSGVFLASKQQIQLFPSLVFKARVLKSDSKTIRDLIDESYRIKHADIAGQKWSKMNYRGGYTSYGSMFHLHLMSPYFGELKPKLDQAMATFLKDLEFDIPKNELKLSSLWVNIMPAGVTHSMHLHPLSVISGSLYLQVPRGSSGIKFEDPRFAQFMAAPPVKRKASLARQRFVELQPTAGEVVLFESWQKHEVPANPIKKDRISVSFNYDWVGSRP